MSIASLIALVLVAVLAFYAGYKLKEDQTRNAVRGYEHYRKTCLRKQGSGLGFGSYNLESYDAGKSWWAVKYDEQGKMEIQGLADQVFPGLLKHIEAMDRLWEYARSNGPLTLSGANAAAEKGLLEGAGFTVEQRKS